MNRDVVSKVLAVVGAACGVVAIVTRPFLFAPIGLLLVLIAARLVPDRRFTAPAIGIVAIGALAGAAVAVGFTKPLY